MGAVRGRSIALGAALALVGLSANLSVATAQDAEARVYAAAKSCAGVQSYLKQYPQGRFRSAAEARIATDCKAAESTSPPRQTPKRTGSADACVQARADWAEIRNSEDIAVLRVFKEAAPASCATQRAQAQARMDELNVKAQRSRDEQARLQAERERAARAFSTSQLSGRTLEAVTAAREVRARAESESLKAVQVARNASASGRKLSFGQTLPFTQSTQLVEVETSNATFLGEWCVCEWPGTNIFGGPNRYGVYSRDDSSELRRGKFENGKFDDFFGETHLPKHGLTYFGQLAKDYQANLLGLSGYGTIDQADGKRVEGNFRFSKLNGYGVVWNADGTARQAGYFELGELVRAE
jgi:hypothetical protein